MAIARARSFNDRDRFYIAAWEQDFSSVIDLFLSRFLSEFQFNLARNLFNTFRKQKRKLISAQSTK
ncbi:MAG: hypothetical protein AAFO76_14205 [Cyanobacteria bacterium J06607_15]